MNERIQELAVQAGIEFTYDPTEVPMRAFIEAWEGDLEKFAELIVRECIDAASEAQADFYIVHNIKSRFGVEE
jgi:hypothetical protein